MNPYRSTAELIARYLDQAAAEPDRVELERRLADPAELHAFVAACRLHNELGAFFAEETQIAPLTAFAAAIEAGGRVERRPGTKPLARHGWAGVAASVLLLIGLGWLRVGHSTNVSSPEKPRTGLVPATTVAPTALVDNGSNARPQAGLPVATAMAVFGIATANSVK
jgi:hypothetical protein